MKHQMNVKKKKKMLRRLRRNLRIICDFTGNYSTKRIFFTNTNKMDGKKAVLFENVVIFKKFK